MEEKGRMKIRLAGKRFYEKVLKVKADVSKLDAEARSCRLKVHRFGRLVRIEAGDLAQYIRQCRNRVAAELAP